MFIDELARGVNGSDTQEYWIGLYKYQPGLLQKSASVFNFQNKFVKQSCNVKLTS